MQHRACVIECGKQPTQSFACRLLVSEQRKVSSGSQARLQYTWLQAQRRRRLQDASQLTGRLLRADDAALSSVENGSTSRKGSGDVSMSERGSTDVELLAKAGPASRVLKFELQLYKLRDGEYCLDVQVS